MTDPLLVALAKPFPESAVNWRVGATSHDKTSALALAYIDARDVMDRLDAVCGLNWQSKHTVHHVGDKGTDLLVTCAIGLLVETKCGFEWIWRTDGSGETDVEGEKGALSKALVRAGVSWGIGRYLYGFPSPWVKVRPNGKSFAIVDDEKARLAGLARKALSEYERNPANRAPLEAPPVTQSAAATPLPAADAQSAALFAAIGAASSPAEAAKAYDLARQALGAREDVQLAYARRLMDAAKKQTTIHGLTIVESFFSRAGFTGRPQELVKQAIAAAAPGCTS